MTTNNSVGELRLADQLSFTTVRLECETPNGISTGTSFIFNFSLSDGKQFECLITNKHVVEGSTSLKCCFTLADQEGKPIDGEASWFKLDGEANNWQFHPDENIDLCAMPLAIFKIVSKSQNKPIFTLSIPDTFIPSTDDIDSLDTVSDILMVGYPTGIWDEKNNKPILRKGITATHPKYDLNGKREFMIHAACFPGSSGSPVFRYFDKTVASPKGIAFTKDVQLLGVLYAGPKFSVQGEVTVVNIPTASVPIAQTSIPNNLGFVIKAKEIMYFKEKFEAMVNGKES